MVRTDWRVEYGASLVAIRGLGGEKGAEGRKLERTGMGRHRSQNCSIDPGDEVQDSHTLPLVTNCLGVLLCSVGSLAGVMVELKITRS